MAQGVHYQRGLHLLRRKLLEASKEEFGTSLQQAKGEHDSVAEVRSLNSLAAVDLERGDFRSSAQFAEHAVREVDARNTEAVVRCVSYVNYMVTRAELGHFDLALDAHRVLGPLVEQADIPLPLLARVRLQQSNVLIETGRLRTAEEHTRQAAHLLR